ncbi:glycosyltransferase family 2 protein [uncultured Shewanella sp.]|uniref:glycosyltransferase family 2 protein n=1 Tax=uncultured Shewanella sp. TaxID=173975 RepID=UPI00262B425A|nr:glycosyltransferase family 2 protein [uncultured Shewanella sp.]
MSLISVVLPAKNEQGNIGLLIQEIHQSLYQDYSFEIVITDDGSDDRTVQEAIEMATDCGCSLQVLSHSHSCGQSTGVYSAVCHANGDWIITSDADGQNDPADYPKLIALAKTQTAEHFCIAGYRHQRLDTPWVRFQSRFANKVRQTLLADGVPDSGCGLKLFPKKTFMLLPYFDHMHRFLPALIKRLGGAIIICPVNHRDRSAGVSNYNVWNRLWVGIIDLVGVFWLRQRAKYPESVIVRFDSNDEKSANN